MGNNPVKYVDPDGRMEALLQYYKDLEEQGYGLGNLGEIFLEDLNALRFEYSSKQKARENEAEIPLTEKKDIPQSEKRPNEVPNGTRDLDKDNRLCHEGRERIKKQLDRKSKDWTGITPEGDIIINDGYGNALNMGNFQSYLW